jgi:hypothetical protein
MGKSSIYRLKMKCQVNPKISFQELGIRTVDGCSNGAASQAGKCNRHLTGRFVFSEMLDSCRGPFEWWQMVERTAMLN